MKSLQILNESPQDFVHIFPLHFIGKSFVEVFSLKCRGIYIFKKITKYFPLKFKGCYLFLHNSVDAKHFRECPRVFYSLLITHSSLYISKNSKLQSQGATMKKKILIVPDNSSKRISILSFELKVQKGFGPILHWRQVYVLLRGDY